MTESAKELLDEKFAQIRDEVTADDRKAATETLNLSDVTIHKYLNGKGTNPDLGIRIYEFFLGKIRERIERLKAIA